MSYAIAIDHNRGTSYFQNYENGFGSIKRAKVYKDRQIAEAALGNISEWLGEHMSATAYYLGYDRATLRVVELDSNAVRA